MSQAKFPGVYDLVLKKKNINTPIYLGSLHVEDSSKGSTVIYKDSIYLIIERSGLPPTGSLLVKLKPAA